MGAIVISKISDHSFLPKLLTKSLKFRKHTPPNVAILLHLVYFGPILIYFSGQKINFKMFTILPIIK